MGELQERLNSEIKKAMLEKDELKRDTLRLLKGEVERTSTSATFDATISKTAKKLVETIKETNSDNGEVLILEDFIIKQLNEDELRDEVIKLKTSNLYGVSDFGKVMGYFKNNYDGQFDGKTLSTVAKEILSN